MADDKFVRVPQVINLETDETVTNQSSCRFIKGLTLNVTQTAAGKDGYNYGVRKPRLGNVLPQHPEFPAGGNTCVGFYESEETNEAYVFVYNHGNYDHFIYRIKGKDGSIQIVYKDPFLDFQLDPRFFISEGRCTLRIVEEDEGPGHLRKGKYLIYTTNYGDQRFISVEDAIDTNSYDNGTFPYFGTDREHFTKLGVPTPLSCVEVEGKPRTDNDVYEQNLLINTGWQFRVKHTDVFGRESEHSIISDRAFVVIGGSCVQTNEGLSRCFKLTLDAGGPLVDKIDVEFRKCNTNQWFRAATFDKYDNCDADEKWYERSIANPYQVKYDELILEGKTAQEAAELADNYLKYNSGNHTFEFTFCNNAECVPVPTDETDRTENPLPLESSGLTALDKGILLSNNLRGFDKLNCNELDKINFSVTPPAGAGCDLNELRTIKVYAVIFNPHQQKFADCHSYNTITGGYGQGHNVFGNGFRPGTEGQLLAPGKEGFLGYLAGTPHFTYSIQGQWNQGFQQFFPYPTFPGGPSPIDIQAYNALGLITVQQFEFKVPPGKYIFRIGQHDITTEEDYQKTSTYVIGRCSRNTPDTVSDPHKKELVIDCCSADVDLKDTWLMIYDLSAGTSNADKSITKCGYVVENFIENYPIELAMVKYHGVGNDVIYTGYTDHNGFWFASTLKDRFEIDVEIHDCTTSQVIPHDIISTQALRPYLNWKEQFYISGNFPAAARRVFSGKVVLCSDNNVGIAGVLVVMQYGQFAYTDSKGNWEIIAHNRYNNPGYGGLGIIDPYDWTAQSDTFIISQAGECAIADCEDPCVFCFADYTKSYVACGVGGRDHDFGQLEANIRGFNQAGLVSGGRYRLGIVMHDWMGRHSYVQSSEEHYIDIPALIDIQQFAHSTVQFFIDNDIEFPDWVKTITPVITKNLKWDEYLNWSADKIEFVDHTGKVNTLNPTKIRIYYGSLAQYNLQNNFSTNTNWQFIDTEGEVPVVGDRVEFIRNGDNTWFTKSITALVRYDKEGKYFEVDYDQELSGLIEGALIRLIRGKSCINLNEFFEICNPIKVVNNKPVVFSGTLYVFDSYFLNRQIPIPTYDNEGNITDVEGKYYNYLFEHDAPSDFYGKGCFNGGRIFYLNPYERQLRQITEMATSKPLLNKSAFNGLSYFETSDIREFSEQEWGQIVVVIVEVNTLLTICEHDSFLVSYKDNRIYIATDGSAVGGSNNDNFSNPQRKIGDNYGCSMVDINTIRKLGHQVIFVDRSRKSVVFHSFNKADSVSDYRYRGWLTEKIKKQNETATEFNNNQIYNYFIAGIDPQNNDYLLSNFGFFAPDIQFAEGELEAALQDPQRFINNQPDVNTGVFETISIDLFTGNLKEFCAFVPEYYGTLKSLNNNLLVIKNGQSWLHNHTGSTTYNNFFGVQTKKYIRLLFNDLPESVKHYLYMQVYCKEHIFISKKVETDAGQLSRLLESAWRKFDDFYAAPFRCDILTPVNTSRPAPTGGFILDGNSLYGKYIEILLESKDEDDSKYCELRLVNLFTIGRGKSDE